VFRLAASPNGLDVWRVDGINVFEAVLRDPRLPETFERIRVPQMMTHLTERRART
jgi:hypothetical protein